jgi:large-conductance mechanosensitive channel
VVVTEEEIVVVTEEEIVVVTEEVTEVEPQNPAIGVTVAKAVMGIVDHSVVAIAQRLIQIIRSRTEITNHTVRPHSVQYNSFLRSSLSILDE